MYCLAALCWGGCGWWSDGADPEEPVADTDEAVASERPDHVLLVVVDTLRADHLGVYGDERGLTPNLDALAEDGVQLAWARSTASTTLASVTSVLTGRYPHSHGVSHNGVRWPARLRSVAQAYQAAGVETAGFVSSIALYREHGVDRGFDVWDQAPDRHHRRSPDTLVQVADWLDGREDKDAPFFAFVHLFDPHYPYQPPAPWDTRFAEEPYEGWFDGSSAHVKRLRHRLRRRDGRANAASRNAQARYAGEVAHLDHQLGLFLDDLTDDGLLDDTLVVVTGDHGETFTEHGPGYFDHGRTVYDTEVHVPLLVTGPGVGKGLVVDDPVSLVDLVPTLLELWGLDDPLWDTVEGVSLAPALQDGHQPGLAERPHFMEATKPHRKDKVWPNRRLHRAVVQGEHKLLHHPRRRDGWRLVVPSEDPDESHNRWSARGGTPVVDGMRGALEAWSEVGPESTAPMTEAPAIIEGLRSLGYME